MSTKSRAISRRVAHRDTVKQSVRISLVLLEDADVLENLRIDLYSLIEADGVFTKKVEDNEMWRLEGNMFAA